MKYTPVLMLAVLMTAGLVNFQALLETAYHTREAERQAAQDFTHYQIREHCGHAFPRSEELRRACVRRLHGDS